MKDVKYYHINIYPQYSMEIGKLYNTENVQREYLGCAENKKDKEEKFENYRKNNCPDKPSRQKCLYVCTDETVKYWIRTLSHKGNQMCRYEVYRIQLEGTTFWGDSIFFIDGDAENYWLGCEYNESGTVEGLFIGNFQILENCTNEFLYEI